MEQAGTRVNDPVALKLLNKAGDMPSLEPPDDETIRTLYIGGFDVRISEQDLRDNFYAHGEIESVKMVLQRACAFVTYTTREGVEKAAEELSNKLVIKGLRLKLMWGRPQVLKPEGEMVSVEARQQAVAHSGLLPRAVVSLWGSNSKPIGYEWSSPGPYKHITSSLCVRCGTLLNTPPHVPTQNQLAMSGVAQDLISTLQVHFVSDVGHCSTAVISQQQNQMVQPPGTSTSQEQPPPPQPPHMHYLNIPPPPPPRHEKAFYPSMDPQRMGAVIPNREGGGSVENRGGGLEQRQQGGPHYAAYLPPPPRPPPQGGGQFYQQYYPPPPYGYMPQSQPPQYQQYPPPFYPSTMPPPGPTGEQVYPQNPPLLLLQQGRNNDGNNFLCCQKNVDPSRRTLGL
ncbi:hypothetical protein OSB04_006555 [Centaurea solstitialis]|uniref:RRM domain-containing protein n=1 Tax=Centaurea solstitialis TaxID=347529 RepID=A0AA38WQC8_9ASTR|nr:hypothetical protein OSB04_006555 [Centaurea solstitialis]